MLQPGLKVFKLNEKRAYIPHGTRGSYARKDKKPWFRQKSRVVETRRGLQAFEETSLIQPLIYRVCTRVKSDRRSRSTEPLPRSQKCCKLKSTAAISFILSNILYFSLHICYSCLHNLKIYYLIFICILSSTINFS